VSQALKMIDQLVEQGLIQPIDPILNRRFSESIYLIPTDFVVSRFGTTDTEDDCYCECECEDESLCGLPCEHECSLAYTLFDVLEMKSEEECMSSVREFIHNDGFRLPIIAVINPDGSLQQYNGHHRLAAALEAGYEYIPYVFDYGWDSELFEDSSERIQHWHSVWDCSEVEDDSDARYLPLLVPSPKRSETNA